MAETRERILRTAARMFSERGYDRVTTREIAGDIGINSASIYHHFISKEEILKSLFKLYEDERKRECPDLDELLALAETEPAHVVLMKSEFHYKDEIREFLDQILVTAARTVNCNPESEEFIRENIFGPIANVLKPLLIRLAELKKIEPFDVETFIGILSYYCFAAAALNSSSFKQGVAEYQSAMSFIFSMITPIERK